MILIQHVPHERVDFNEPAQGYGIISICYLDKTRQQKKRKKEKKGKEKIKKEKGEKEKRERKKNPPI